MSIFGGNRESDNKVFGGFGNEYRMKETGTHPIRFLAGPVEVYQCFIPVIGVDRDTGEEEPKLYLVLRKAKGGVFDILAAIDLKIKRDMGIPKDDIQSCFKYGGKKFAYLGFPRNTGEIAVQRILVGWTVVDELRKKQEMVSKKKSDRLMYGLYFMWDALCEREYDAKKKGAEMNKTSYSVDVDNSENGWAHKTPISWLPSQGEMPENFDPMDSGVLEEKGHQPIFTDEEIVAVESFLEENSTEEDGDLVAILERMYAPLNDEEIAVFLAENRLNLSAEDNNGVEMFPDPEAFLKAVNNNPQLAEYFVGSSEENGKKQISAPKDEKEDDSFDFGDNKEEESEEDEPKKNNKKKVSAKKKSLKDRMKAKKEPVKEKEVAGDDDFDW